MTESNESISPDSRMIDVGEKPETDRMARARAVVKLSPAVFDAVFSGTLPKGDALSTARVAGILAAKKTPSLLPLCHPVRLTSVDLSLEAQGEERILVEARVRGKDRTGFEMEALTAVTTAALVVYDMTKSLEPGVVIEEVRLVEKQGGKSGHWKG